MVRLSTARPAPLRGAVEALERGEPRLALSHVAVSSTLARANRFSTLNGEAHDEHCTRRRACADRACRTPTWSSVSETELATIRCRCETDDADGGAG